LLYVPIIVFGACRGFGVARFSTGQLHEPMLRQLRRCGKRETDAHTLRLTKAQLCHHFISAVDANATRL